MVESYRTAGIIQGISREGCPGGFTCLLRLKKGWRIKQLKARSDDVLVGWIIARSVNLPEQPPCGTSWVMLMPVVLLTFKQYNLKST